MSRIFHYSDCSLIVPLSQRPTSSSPLRTTLCPVRLFLSQCSHMQLAPASPAVRTLSSDVPDPTCFGLVWVVPERKIYVESTFAWLNVLFIYIRGGQPDEHREPHFRRQLRQEPCLYSSSQTYGSNTARCLREISQGEAKQWRARTALWSPLLYIIDICVC